MSVQSKDPAQDYFDRLKAPVKGFYSFGRSAHSPILEEPEKVQENHVRGRAGGGEQPR